MDKTINTLTTNNYLYSNVGVSDSKKTLTQELQTQELQKDSVNINSIKEDDASLKDIVKSALKTAYKSLNTVGGGLLGAAMGAIGFSTVGFAWLPAIYINKIDSILEKNEKTATEKASDIAKNLLLYLPMEVILHPIMGGLAGLFIGALGGYTKNAVRGVLDVAKNVAKYNEITKDLLKTIKDPDYPNKKMTEILFKEIASKKENKVSQ
jgi:predicted PurR-regulated permease PerM